MGGSRFQRTVHVAALLAMFVATVGMHVIHPFLHGAGPSHFWHESADFCCHDHGHDEARNLRSDRGHVGPHGDCHPGQEEGPAFTSGPHQLGMAGACHNCPICNFLATVKCHDVGLADSSPLSAADPLGVLVATRPAAQNRLFVLSLAARPPPSLHCPSIVLST